MTCLRFGDTIVALSSDFFFFNFFLQNRKLMPKFVLKEIESLYIEELKSSINLLMANLESLPVSKGSMDSKYGLQKLKRYNHR
jgi:hypothetical protein